jgi:hypothetical protein
MNFFPRKINELLNVAVIMMILQWFKITNEDADLLFTKEDK